MNFKDKVVYQIYPKSFQDTNGDGIGDLGGVLKRLDYLKSLGVDYLWLTPFFPSPQRDNGYDVADYCAVDPRFGTMEEIETLIAEAEKRGIGLMLDMVLIIHQQNTDGFKKHWQERKNIRIIIYSGREIRSICRQTGSLNSADLRGNMFHP